MLCAVRKSSYLEGSDKVGLVAAAPVLEALAALDDSKWGELVAIGGGAMSE